MTVRISPTAPEARPPLIEPAELPEPPTPRSLALDMIEGAVAALLPHAVNNVMQPFETPLRWYEGRMQDEPEPFCFSLWANLTSDRSRKFEINRTLPADMENPNRLWSCSITRPLLIGLLITHELETSAAVRKNGAVELSTTQYQVLRGADRDTDRRICTDVEVDSELSPERRQEILGYMSTLLSAASFRLPTAQAVYCFENNIPQHRLTFSELASPVTRRALGPVLALPAHNYAER